MLVYDVTFKLILDGANLVMKFPCYLLVAALELCLIASASSANTPFKVDRRWIEDDRRRAYGLRARLDLAIALMEIGDTERGNQQLRAVERTVNSLKEGFIFNSGNQVDDAVLARAKDQRGYLFGVRRQGHSGKSTTLSALSRFYTAKGDIDQAKALIRRIPSDHEQLRAAEQLVIRLSAIGKDREAVEYRQEVLDELDWDQSQLSSLADLRSSAGYQFAAKTAFSMLKDYVAAGKTEQAERIAQTFREWLDLRNESDQNPDVVEYRKLATTLIRYYLRTNRQGAAQAVADASTKKWLKASLPDSKARLRPSLESNREKQIAFFDLIMKQPISSSYQITTNNLTADADNFPTRFVEIELLEATDQEAAKRAYFDLGKEINAESERCKRYLGPVIDALIRLDDRTAATELVNELQGNLPQQKLKRCPITAFQYYTLNYADGLDLAPLLKNIGLQESKLTSVERLRISGLDTARAYAEAGNRVAAMQLLDRTSNATNLQDYALLRRLIVFRYQAFGEIRDDEIKRLVESAQADLGRNWKRRLSQTRLASVAKLFIQLDRQDWAEELVDVLTPESKVEQKESPQRD